MFTKRKDNWMQFLVVIVGQACSLKCKDCSNLAPYAPHESLKYDIDDIKRSISLIIKNMGGIVKVQIQGGEPFLYTELDELLIWLRKSRRIKEITITTNGTIIPRENVLRAIAKSKAWVSISNYKEVVDEKKVENLCEKFDEYGIKHVKYSFADEENIWRELGGIGAIRESDDELVKKRYDMCPFKWCMTLEKNRLGYCSRSINASKVQGFEGAEGDEIDLWAEKDLKTALIKYCFWNRGAHPMEACRYCRPDGKKVQPAIQLK